jgi:hypothetical protein
MKVSEECAAPIIRVSKDAGSCFIQDGGTHLPGCILTTHKTMIQMKKVVMIDSVKFLCFGWCFGDIKRRSCHLYTYLHGKYLLSYVCAA